jgi:predicted DNA-binding transcriptional regulator YafY
LLADEAVEVDPVKIHETFGRGYGIFGGAPVGRAKLKFSARRARWVAQEEWHPDQVSSVLPDGTLMLEVPYSDTRELIGEILRHGTDVEVIEPPALREQAAATIDKMLNVYR